MPGSIPEVDDPKLGPAVKIAIWQCQNLYFKHIRGHCRIFFQDPPSHELQNEPPWAFISARYQNLYVFARTHQAYQSFEGPWDLVPTAEGHPVGVSGRCWSHFDANWCGLDAGTTTVCARVDPGRRRPKARGCCENCHLATPKYIFRTHRR